MCFRVSNGSNLAIQPFQGLGYLFRRLRGSKGPEGTPKKFGEAGSAALFSGAKSLNGLTKPKNRTKSTKELSEQFEGVTGHYPVKQGVFGRIAPESSPKRSAKSLSHSFFVVPFLSPIFVSTLWEKMMSFSEALDL